ncbi:MAG: tRNA (adenosine(37)-N6)-threonylcarbamoyltransferase complex ATPase subunit type 1 TsaE [Kiritimatiellae bacterium]|nr:tRNA (adenosine(37)-N6)-threonylcarbamoyltransferase complex ATPase subunit type 1 TsaE [Kiritimatiellia bacterium]
MEPERTSHSVRETQAFAAELARRFGPGRVWALEGDLGAGKTAFVAGLCAGLGVRAAVSSPTFAIANEYRDAASRRRVVHLDLYRLSGPEELDSVGWDDYLDSGDTLAVEWPERAGDRLPPDAVRVRIGRGPGEDDRRLLVSAPPA